MPIGPLPSLHCGHAEYSNKHCNVEDCPNYVGQFADGRAEMFEPEFKWVARDLEIGTVRLYVEALLRYDKPSGSFKIHNKIVGETTRTRYDVFFDDVSCRYLQEAWEGWDPEPNCNHVTNDSPWYPHCAEMTCWNYVNRSHNKP